MDRGVRKEVKSETFGKSESAKNCGDLTRKGNLKGRTERQTVF